MTTVQPGNDDLLVPGSERFERLPPSVKAILSPRWQAPKPRLIPELPPIPVVTAGKKEKFEKLCAERAEAFYKKAVEKENERRAAARAQKEEEKARAAAAAAAEGGEGEGGASAEAADGSAEGAKADEGSGGAGSDDVMLPPPHEELEPPDDSAAVAAAASASGGGGGGGGGGGVKGHASDRVKAKELADNYAKAVALHNKRERARAKLREAIAAEELPQLQEALKLASQARMEGIHKDGRPWRFEVLSEALKLVTLLESREQQVEVQRARRAQAQAYAVRREPLGTDRHGRRYWRFPSGSVGQSEIFVEWRAPPAAPPPPGAQRCPSSAWTCAARRGCTRTWATRWRCASC
jgi:hypothetical protein